jgi:hypothetical protein
MEGEFLIPIMLFMSIAAVMIFRPLTTRLGKSIEQSHDKKVAGQDPQVERMMQLMERMVDRMDRLEEKVDFTERMLESQRRQAVLSEGPGGAADAAQRGESRARRGEDV